MSATAPSPVSSASSTCIANRQLFIARDERETEASDVVVKCGKRAAWWKNYYYYYYYYYYCYYYY